MPPITVACHAMATRFEIVLHGEREPALRAAGEEALRLIEELEARLSLFRSGSEIAHVNARAAREPVRVTPEVFALLQPFAYGNAFTNANKAIDHFKAFGPKALRKEGPMLHAKVRLPEQTISGTGAILTRYGLMPDKGYLE